MLVCLEMAIFAMLHIFSYSWQPYRVDQTVGLQYKGGPFGIIALIEAANVLDIVREIWRSWRWVFTGRG